MVHQLQSGGESVAREYVTMIVVKATTSFKMNKLGCEPQLVSALAASAGTDLAVSQASLAAHDELATNHPLHQEAL